MSGKISQKHNKHKKRPHLIASQFAPFVSLFNISVYLGKIQSFHSLRAYFMYINKHLLDLTGVLALMYRQQAWLWEGINFNSPI